MDNYGYIVHIASDESGNPVKQVFGSSSNDASRVMYNQSGTDVTVQKKIQDIDKTLGEDIVIADDSNAWVSGADHSYTVGMHRIYNAKVYECITNCNGTILPTNTTYWRELTLSDVSKKLNEQTKKLNDLVIVETRTLAFNPTYGTSDPLKRNNYHVVKADFIDTNNGPLIPYGVGDNYYYLKALYYADMKPLPISSAEVKITWLKVS